MKNKLCLYLLALSLLIPSSWAFNINNMGALLVPPPNSQSYMSDPDYGLNEQWYYEQAANLLVKGRYNKANRLATQGIREYPESIPLYYALFLSYYLVGNREPASAALAKMISIDSNVVNDPNLKPYFSEFGFIR
jgi:tetratricopeptide (TPR) repeat protein